MRCGTEGRARRESWQSAETMCPGHGFRQHALAGSAHKTFLMNYLILILFFSQWETGWIIACFVGSLEDQSR